MTDYSVRNSQMASSPASKDVACKFPIQDIKTQHINIYSDESLLQRNGANDV